MDYKEKYELALERAKEFMTNKGVAPNADAFKTAKELTEIIFPELKESEDEKIRKCLLSHFSRYQEDETFLNDITMKQIVAWLEKQGEHKPDPRYGILDELIEADDIYQMAMNDAMVEEARNKAIKALSKLEISKLLDIEKQGEQKPTECTLKDAATIFLDALSKTPYNNKPITDAQVITRELLKFLSDACSYNPDAINEQKPTCLSDNSVSNVKFPFKAKVKSNGKIVTIHDGQLSMDCKEWIKYQSDTKDGYVVYTPDDLELVCDIEQKLSDKAEPKFKVGDWIYHEKSGNTIHINRIEKVIIYLMAQK